MQSNPEFLGTSSPATYHRQNLEYFITIALIWQIFMNLQRTIHSQVHIMSKIKNHQVNCRRGYILTRGLISRWYLHENLLNSDDNWAWPWFPLLRYYTAKLSHQCIAILILRRSWSSVYVPGRFDNQQVFQFAHVKWKMKHENLKVLREVHISDRFTWIKVNSADNRYFTLKSNSGLAGKPRISSAKKQGFQ